jgi:tryptophan 2,3-dioxygenase
LRFEFLCDLLFVIWCFYLCRMSDPKKVHYGDYLQLEKILQAQFPESDKLQAPAHDEMLFIVIHQAYELWFKQLLHEAGSVIEILKKPALNDNSPELQTVVHRLSRMVTILRVLVHQVDIMETMTPMDFLDFRDMLRPASGFQSVQFKLLEARLGLKFEHRHGQEYYVSQLRPAEVEQVKKGEADSSLVTLLNAWLERMPFYNRPDDPFWTDYRNRYEQSLSDAERSNLEVFDRLFISDEPVPGQPARNLSAAASRAALFIMLYRGYPILQLPFQLLNNLLEIDEQLSTWRYRHVNMVQRMIGTRIGTGGSSGRDYLRSALDKHYIFKDISQLTSFLIERRKLPQLSPDMERRLGFVQ